MSRFFDQLSDQNHLVVGLNRELGDPWHGNGAFDDAVPLDAAVRVLTVNAAKRPLFTQQVDGVDDQGNLVITTEPVLSGGKPLYGVFDEDTGHCFQAGVGDGYTIHDYTDLIEWLAALVDAGAGEVEIGCAMALGHKEQAMVQIRPHEGVVIGGDKILPWLAAHSSLDSSWATGIKACRTRLVCDNTGRMIMGEGNPTYKIKHTKNSKLRIAEAREVIGIMFESIDDMAAEIDRLQNTTLTDPQFGMVVDRTVPITDDKGNPLDGRAKTIAESKRETLARLWVQDPRVAPFRGTVWGAVQAHNTAVTHEFTVRGASAGISRTDRQAINTVNGRIDTVDAETIKAINEVFDNLGLATV